MSKKSEIVAAATEALRTINGLAKSIATVAEQHEATLCKFGIGITINVSIPSHKEPLIQVYMGSTDTVIRSLKEAIEFLNKEQCNDSSATK